MPQHDQVCVITTEAVYLAVLKTDGRLWGDMAESGVYFSYGTRPMDRAVEAHEDGLVAYLDRVH